MQVFNNFGNLMLTISVICDLSCTSVSDFVDRNHLEFWHINFSRNDVKKLLQDLKSDQVGSRIW
jgi:hypothetical protein